MRAQTEFPEIPPESLDHMAVLRVRAGVEHDL